MRLMMNGLPGPLPIPLGAMLGWHVFVVTLDVVLFLLTEAMWIVSAVVCMCLCVCICVWLKMMETELQKGSKASLNYAKATLYTQLWQVDAHTSEINYKTNIMQSKIRILKNDVGQWVLSYSQRSWQELNYNCLWPLLQYHNDSYMVWGFKMLAGEWVAWVLVQFWVLI